MSLLSKKSSTTYCHSPQYYDDTRKLQRFKTKMVGEQTVLKFLKIFLFILANYKLNEFKRQDGENLEEIIWSPGMRNWYILHLFFKLILELLGLAALYLLQFQMHENSRKTFMEIFWTVPFSYDCTIGFG